MTKPKLPYTKKDLHRRSPQPNFRGRNLEHIAFPLGGIGTGTLGLGGWGQLRDWEVRNRPAKGFAPAHAFFTLKLRQDDKAPITRVVQGPPAGDHIGGGHTMPRHTGAGLPHFRTASFRGQYPQATIQFRDPHVPVRVTLDAFNPFIPLNATDSGIPVAILNYRVKNNSREPVDAMLVGSLANFIGQPRGRRNAARKAPGLAGLSFTTQAHPKSSPHFGSVALVTMDENAAMWPHWAGGHADLMKFWEALAWSDTFPPPIAGDSDTGSVAARAIIPGGGEKTFHFLIAWHFPTVEHWKPSRGTTPTWRNHYAAQWDSAWDVAEYVVSHYDRLREETRRFHDTLFASTLPVHVLDAVSSQLAVLRSPTCLRLEDGALYAFEGCSDTEGCCEGSCTHVWNYAQAVAYLFPELQRSMLEAHLEHSMSPDGYIQFRMPMPLGTPATASFLPAADGQMGLVTQVYREWLLTGDDKWLERVWPQAKKALEFAWKYWDANRDGVMEGVQHNTYDQEWWGPNTMTGSLYLAALRAGEEIARHLGDSAAASGYRDLFEQGSAWTDANLFNDDYYEQQVNTKANALWPEPYHTTNDRGKDDVFPTWPRWQFGRGCLSDQMIGQWLAALLDLGYLYDRKHVRKTLRSIFRHNWRPDLHDHACTLRIYAVNDEAGLLIATWPRGERPGYPFWFADEVWCGIEYQVASHLIHEGMVDEGLAIVKGVRDRHRGDRRNPWDEFECGHHYARSMASYALLLSLSGFRYRAESATIAFAPRIEKDDFRTFFSVADAWGLYAQKTTETKTELTLRVDYGALPLARIVTPLIKRRTTGIVATLGGEERQATLAKADVGYAI
ncbi:hypothetical protein HQ560_13260, partial [bacterium]|nr:hypothetical protein [bacterium]